MPFGILERWSPEYAVNNLLADMRSSGLEGLKKHLTAKALKTVEGFEKISGIPEVSILSNTLLGGDAMNILLGHLSDCEWTIEDVMKGDATSKAILGFDFDGKMVGTIELTLIKENDIWKVDKLGVPKFDVISLPQIEADPSEQ